MFLNDALKKVNFEKKLSDDNKSIKIVQREKSYIEIIHVSTLPQSKAHILRRIPKIGRKVIEYSYVSGQCGQTIDARNRDAKFSQNIHVLVQK